MLLLVDLDGVVYRGSQPVPGVAAVLAARAAAGDDVVYVTNNSAWYRADYVTRLTAMGAPVTADRVVSSARATALYLARQQPPIRTALVLGGEGLRRELADVGIEPMAAADAAERWAQNGHDAAAAICRPDRPDALVIGLDPDVTYGRLAVAAEAVRLGARFIASNRDPVLPTEHGLQPGAGSLIAAVAAAARQEPEVSIGKPGPLLLQIAAQAAGAAPSSAVMIGDSLLSDMPAAIAVGARSILMMTGVTADEQLAALPAGEHPTAVAHDADELAAVLERFGRAQAG